jgi:hypothetical protein
LKKIRIGKFTWAEFDEECVWHCEEDEVLALSLNEISKETLALGLPGHPRWDMFYSAAEWIGADEIVDDEVTMEYGDDPELEIDD